MKVLLVDDDTDLLDLLAFVLVREGYRVVTATDGAEALARWRKEQPDLVVLDVGLPRVDGFEVCRQIRQGSVTPVILLTGRSEAEDVAQGRRVGANDYVTKPFSHQQLSAHVAAVLRRDGGDVSLDGQSGPGLDTHPAACAR